MKRRWTIRLAEAAGQDYQAILHWTAEHFGRAQARTYAKTLSSALQDLSLPVGLFRWRTLPSWKHSVVILIPCNVAVLGASSD